MPWSLDRSVYDEQYAEALTEAVEEWQERYQQEFSATEGHPRIGRMLLTVMAREGDYFTEGEGQLWGDYDRRAPILWQQAQWKDPDKAASAIKGLDDIKLPGQKPKQRIDKERIGIGILYFDRLELQVVHAAVRERLAQRQQLHAAETGTSPTTEELVTGGVRTARRVRRRKAAAANKIGTTAA